MITEPDEVAAPAADATLFRASRARFFAVRLVTFVAAFLVVGPMVSRLLGDDDPGPGWSTLVQGLFTGMLLAACLTFGTDGWRRAWVRTSAGGLELMIAGSDPVHLEWANVADARVRRTRLRWILEVTPADLSQVRQVQEGNGMPIVRGGAFPADVTLLAPGPRRLRAELTRRLTRPSPA